MEQTLMMIKPDAVGRNLIGEILARVEKAGMRFARLRMVHLTPAQARDFYRVHEGKPFLDSLVSFMASGPIIVGVVEGERAIQRLAEIVGATDPGKAAPGTIRRDFGLDIEKNSVHRSDAPETAAQEIRWFDLTLSLR